MYMSVLVKNAPSPVDLQPPSSYGTWIEYWEGKSGKKLKTYIKYKYPAGDCSEVCYRKDFDGWHVQNFLDSAHKVYIIPLCSSCNHRNDYFFVDEKLLVPIP